MLGVGPGVAGETSESEPADPESDPTGTEDEPAKPEEEPAGAGGGDGAADAEGDSANGTGTAPRDGGGAQKPPSPWYLWPADVTHSVLSRGIEGTAKGIDSFFATEEALEEATRSFIKLQGNAAWIESRGDFYEFNVDARLDLPGTEDRFQLLVESDPERSTAAGEDDPDADSPVEAAEEEEEDFTLAVEAWLEGERDVNWQIRPALGMRVSLPLNPFTRLRVIRRDQYAKWDSRLSTTLAYFYREGVLFNAAQDFDRPLSDTLLFRSRSAYGWRRQPDVETFQQTFSLFKTLTERRRVAYEAGMRSDDQPTGWEVTDYFVRIRYRQRVYKEWLFAEVQPQVRWPKAANFDHEAGLLFRLEAVFSAKSLRRSRRADGR